MKHYIFAFFFFAFISSAHAFEEQAVYSQEEYSIETIHDQISNFISTPEGGISWQTFAKTKEHEKVIQVDDRDWHYSQPEFPEDLQKLDGQKIKIAGYMFPLYETEDHDHFLFGPFPLTCPYHYHTPLSLTMEVRADPAIPFTYDPVIIEGTLKLIPEDKEHNIFYHLTNVTVVEK